MKPAVPMQGQLFDGMRLLRHTGSKKALIDRAFRPAISAIYGLDHIPGTPKGRVPICVAR